MENLVPLKEIFQKLIESGLNKTQIANKAKICKSYITDTLKGRITGDRKYWFIVNNLGIAHSKVFINNEAPEVPFIKDPNPFYGSEPTMKQLLKETMEENFYLKEENKLLKEKLKPPERNGTEERRHGERRKG